MGVQRSQVSLRIEARKYVRTCRGGATHARQARGTKGQIVGGLDWARARSAIRAYSLYTLHSSTKYTADPSTLLRSQYYVVRSKELGRAIGPSLAQHPKVHP